MAWETESWEGGRVGFEDGEGRGGELVLENEGQWVEEGESAHFQKMRMRLESYRPR